MEAGTGGSSLTGFSTQMFLRLQGHQYGFRTRSRDNADRFIPNRSAMDFDYAHYMLMEGRKGKKKEKEKPEEISLAKAAYRKLLAEAHGMRRTRILEFKNKPPAPVTLEPNYEVIKLSGRVKPRRYISQGPERILEAPGMDDNYYLNLLDWGSGNILAIALGTSVYLWNAYNGSVSELVRTEDDSFPVTSLKWAPDGQRIAVAFDDGDIQLWDSMSNRKLRTLSGSHQSRVGALDWNNHILTTGGKDGQIVNHDVRIGEHIVQRYIGHHQEVCGIKWSASGRHLASGGDDYLLHIWDRSMASSNSPTQRHLHRFEDHTAAVKALAWCPFQSDLLASGGGTDDRSIKFWNIHTGSCMNSIDTGSQVCALLWNKNERELLSSHGFEQNQLTLWKYPSMTKITQLSGHQSRVLFMAESPDGCSVASASGDEKLMIWNVFGDPEEAAKKPAPKADPEPFANWNRIR